MKQYRISLLATCLLVVCAFGGQASASECDVSESHSESGQCVNATVSATAYCPGGSTPASVDCSCSSGHFDNQGYIDKSTSIDSYDASAYTGKFHGYVGGMKQRSPSKPDLGTDSKYGKQCTCKNSTWSCRTCTTTTELNCTTSSSNPSGVIGPFFASKTESGLNYGSPVTTAKAMCPNGLTPNGAYSGCKCSGSEAIVWSSDKKDGNWQCDCRTNSELPVSITADALVYCE